MGGLFANKVIFHLHAFELYCLVSEDHCSSPVIQISVRNILDQSLSRTLEGDCTLLNKLNKFVVIVQRLQ